MKKYFEEAVVENIQFGTADVICDSTYITDATGGGESVSGGDCPLDCPDD